MSHFQIMLIVNIALLDSCRTLTPSSINFHKAHKKLPVTSVSEVCVLTVIGSIWRTTIIFSALLIFSFMDRLWWEMLQFLHSQVSHLSTRTKAYPKLDTTHWPVCTPGPFIQTWPLSICTWLLHQATRFFWISPAWTSNTKLNAFMITLKYRTHLYRKDFVDTRVETRLYSL